MSHSHDDSGPAAIVAIFVLAVVSLGLSGKACADANREQGNFLTRDAYLTNVTLSKGECTPIDNPVCTQNGHSCPDCSSRFSNPFDPSVGGCCNFEESCCTDWVKNRNGREECRTRGVTQYRVDHDSEPVQCSEYFLALEVVYTETKNFTTTYTILCDRIDNKACVALGDRYFIDYFSGAKGPWEFYIPPGRRDSVVLTRPGGCKTGSKVIMGLSGFVVGIYLLIAMWVFAKC